MDWFFGSWDEDVIVPVAEDNEPISSMNPELLAKAENRSENIDEFLYLDYFLLAHNNETVTLVN